MIYFPDSKNTYGVDISNYSNSELLEFYDNPDNFYIKDCRDELYNYEIADNFILSLTHGSYDLPSGYEEFFFGDKNKDNLILLKNFSDWGTTPLVNSMNLRENQIVRTHFSRVIGDCNRDIDNKSKNGFLRKKDFGNITLFDDVEVFRKKGEEHHKDYHSNIENKLLEIEKKGKKSFLFDIHDTGVLFMGENADSNYLDKSLFPLISLADVHGSSCDREILDYLAIKINKYLGIKVEINAPFKGGYVTKLHGSDYRKKYNNTFKRNVIQVEIGRFLYMKESNQQLYNEKIEIIAEGLKRAINDVVIKFS